VILAALPYVFFIACSQHNAQAHEPRPYRVFAGQLDQPPPGLLFAPDGSTYVAEQHGGSVKRIDTAGRISRVAQGLRSPHGLALDPAGNMYVAETGADRVAKIDRHGAVSTFIVDLDSPVDLDFAPDGELRGCELSGKVRAFSPQQRSRVIAELKGPHGLAFGAAGLTYINEWRGTRVVKLVAGSVAPFADVAGPVGIAVGRSGDVFVAQPQARPISRVSADGKRSDFATNRDEPRRAARPRLRQPRQSVRRRNARRPHPRLRRQFLSVHVSAAMTSRGACTSSINTPSPPSGNSSLPLG
jgi:DNA-binding beta-propeller fold protein YncE